MRFVFVILFAGVFLGVYAFAQLGENESGSAPGTADNTNESDNDHIGINESERFSFDINEEIEDYVRKSGILEKYQVVVNTSSALSAVEGGPALRTSNNMYLNETVNQTADETVPKQTAIETAPTQTSQARQQAGTGAY